MTFTERDVLCNKFVFSPWRPSESHRWQWNPSCRVCNDVRHIPPTLAALLLPCQAHTACCSLPSDLSTLKIRWDWIASCSETPRQRTQANKLTWWESVGTLTLSRLLRCRWQRVINNFKCKINLLLAYAELRLSMNLIFFFLNSLKFFSANFFSPF